MQKLITKRELADQKGITPSGIDKQRARYPDFPKPVQVGPGPTSPIRWDEAAIDAFYAEKAREVEDNTTLNTGLENSLCAKS